MYIIYIYYIISCYHTNIIHINLSYINNIFIILIIYKMESNDNIQNNKNESISGEYEDKKIPIFLETPNITFPFHV